MSTGTTSFSLSLDRDFQVRFLGWALLFFWVAAMVYIARDFFFPSFYGPDVQESKYNNDESYDQLLLNTEEIGDFV